MNKKTTIIFIKCGVVFLLLGLLVGKIYDIGLHRPPLMFANIPEATQIFIKQLGRDSRDLGLSYTKQGPFDWDNNEDLGNDENEKWKSESDANFVVYYHPGNDATWQSRAQEVLHQAQENIDYLKDFMGKYYYADDMNGRRLAIYLPETEDLYKQTISSLMEGGSGQGAAGTTGITITQVGPLGCMTRGIVLSPICFENPSNGVNGYKRVLKHEMCHYVFFSSLDYSKNIRHYAWVSEGIAEYFSNYRNHKPVFGTDSINTIKQSCHLNKEFPLENNSSYWAGESFFGFLEAEKGKDAVKNFVKNAYTHSTDSVFVVMKYDPRQLHKKWVDVLSHINSNRAADMQQEASPEPSADGGAAQQQAQSQQQSQSVQKVTPSTPKSPSAPKSPRRRHSRRR